MRGRHTLLKIRKSKLILRVLRPGQHCPTDLNQTIANRMSMTGYRTPPPPQGSLTLWVWVPTLGFASPHFGNMAASDLASRLPITAPHFCNISELLPKMGTCNVKIVPQHLIIEVCLCFACKKDCILNLSSCILQNKQHLTSFK